MRPVPLVALACLVVLSGCVGGILGPQEDPDDDTLGWENGYWHNDSLSITESDGLNETEREAVIARTMARVEVIRGLEFNESVSVTLISREEYRSRRNTDWADEPTTYDLWNEQVWEGLFLVSEDATVSDAFGGVYGSAVQGYYSGGGEITLVSDSETPMVDRTTLSHELVHALQDQHFGFGGGRDTQDGELASDGLTEGDANYVERLYETRCQAEWDCISRPERGSGTPDDFNRGVFSVIYQPYAEGPTFVETLRDRGGWAAVNDAYDDIPQSTEQVIHPEDYPDDRPVELDVPDRSSAGWGRFSFDNRPNADTVGEASIYAMLWANGVVTDQSAYAYAFPASTGWAGDSLVPYQNGDEYGYVWMTEWESEEDAREFLAAYQQVLERNGAVERTDGVYRIPEGEPFADAFRVTRSGTRVKIVNAPTVADLANIDG